MRHILFILILSLIISSCGPAATEAPAATEEPAAPAATEEPAAPELTEEPMMPEDTPTLEPIPTEVSPTPTETPLPKLDLPALIPNAPSLLAWDGKPTYLGRFAARL